MGYKRNGLITGWPSPILDLPANTRLSTLFLFQTSLSQREQQLQGSHARAAEDAARKEWPRSATSPPAPPTTTTASRQPPPPSSSIASPFPPAPSAPAPAPSPVSNSSPPSLLVGLLSSFRSQFLLLQVECGSPMSCFSAFGGGRLISLLAGVYALSNDIRVGTNVEVDGAPWKVLGDKHSPPFVFPFLLLSEGYPFTCNCSRICNTVALYQHKLWRLFIKSNVHVPVFSTITDLGVFA